MRGVSVLRLWIERARGVFQSDRDVRSLQFRLQLYMLVTSLCILVVIETKQTGENDHNLHL